ncbi:putative alcohol dehydrogenase [Aspergillus sclerotioniger CBS 115572]|uniref:Putative alcohol dehydrogenase n=1 Tax=Aspergillus sclerotioniger CBS 115572 TaxID=1450535 RepID=A0A317V395_9EURO|nr:putative alcohol dehydrogenase [Aspergillus sclerotioniger CBS 115572]PWY68506.1 putative alcohol dehydrogenase [Aspergillus sclerotioniger CBS 115572]
MQKSIVIQNLSEPASLAGRHIPSPGDNQLLLQVTATSLNPVDQKTRDAGLFFTQAPQVLGHDISGKVLQLGPHEQTPKFQPGDVIFAHANLIPGGVMDDYGGLQQYAIVDSRFAAKIDEAGLTDVEAVTIPVCAIAAFIAFFHSTGFGLAVLDGITRSRDGSKAILVVGGGSNCGRFAIQFAKLCGFERIVTTASIGRADELRELGATHVVDRYGSREVVVSQVRDIVGDELVFAIDTMGLGSEQDVGVAALSNSKRGCLITLNPVSEVEPEKGLVGEKLAGFDRRLTIGLSALYPEVSGVFWERVGEWVRGGHLRPLTCRVFEGLNVVKVNEVLDAYRDGYGQKVVFRP